jgi:hypothetical protein
VVFGKCCRRVPGRVVGWPGAGSRGLWELRANLGADAKLTGWIDRCVEEIRCWFVKPELECVMKSVGPNGEILDHFDGRTLNPGHAIEGAWFKELLSPFARALVCRTVG